MILNVIRPGVLAGAVAAALASTHLGVSGAAPIDVGPGVVDPFEINTNTDHRFLAGTEIISHVSTVRSDVVFGGNALDILGGKMLFEGGVYEGASVMAEANLTYAIGGRAIFTYDPYHPSFEIRGGAFRGGSVILASSDYAGIAHPGSAIELSSRAYIELTIYDGVFEGGVVIDPANPLQDPMRDYAITSTHRGRSKIDVFGGTINGGLLLSDRSTVTFYGSAFDVQPSLDGMFRGDKKLTITGVYNDGTAFTHHVDVHADEGIVVRGSSFLSIGLGGVPEPPSVVTAVMGIIGAVRWRGPHNVRM